MLTATQFAQLVLAVCILQAFAAFSGRLVYDGLHWFLMRRPVFRRWLRAMRKVWL